MKVHPMPVLTLSPIRDCGHAEQIYLAAIKGLVPTELVRMVRAYLDFTYLIRHPVQTEETLARSEAALAEYHTYREFLRDTGVRPADGFSIPRQHSHTHASRHTWNFGALHGLCTSITENKHIKAVKEPWRRSNRYEALGQMLLTNQRLDKLTAARTDFKARGMLNGSCYAAALLAFFASIDSDLGSSDGGGGDDRHAEEAPDDSRPDEQHEDADDGLPTRNGTLEGDPIVRQDASEAQEGAVDLGEEEEDEGIVDGPTLEAYVELARRPGECIVCCQVDDNTGL